MLKLKDLVFYVLFPLAVLFFLIFNSDLPPTGNVWNELNTVYWGLVVNIAEKWRSLNFSFWDPQTGGGVSFYTSGFYPIFNPTNVLAFVLDNGHFFVFKVLEPYVWGSLAAVIFLNFLGIRKSYAACAAIAYLTLTFGNWSNISIQSSFMWGPALFPLMLFAFFRNAKTTSFNAGAIWAGAVIALQFLVAGMPQVLQVLAWCACFAVAAVVARMGSLAHLRQAVAAYILMFISFIGLCAFQLVPTMAFFFLDAAQRSGRYPVNTLYLWGPPHPSFPSLTWIFQKNNEWLRFDAGLIFLIVLLLLLLLNINRIKLEAGRSKIVAVVLAATVLYVCVPSMAGTLAKINLFFARLVAPISAINFSYGLYFLDFSVVLLACYLVSLQGGLRHKDGFGRAEKFLHYAGNVLAFAMVVFVVVTACQIIFKKPPHEVAPLLFTRGEKFFVLFCALCTLGLGLLSFSPKRNAAARAVFVAVLLWGGSAHLLGSYHLLGRAEASDTNKAVFAAPEHRFFAAARDKFYILSAQRESCLSVSDHYNLLYGVRGLGRVLPIPSHRFAKFQQAYNHETDEKSPALATYYLIGPTAALSTYFPVDFTLIEHGKELDWPGFKKTVAGNECDVWENTKPSWKLRLPVRAEALDFDGIVKRMGKEPYQDTLYVEDYDAKTFRVPLTSYNGGPRTIADYKELKGDRISFRVSSENGTYVIVPQMFHHGWHAWIDGKRVAVFPADFLFLGLQVFAGDHEVILQFVPPGLLLGFVMFAAVAGLFILKRQFFL